MKEGAAEFWAAAMFGGPGTSDGQTEKVEYDPGYLGGLFKGGRVEGAE